MDKLTKKLRYELKITLLSGLHIGASKEVVEIGGLDNPVIRDKVTNQPYIPGSSIKGKIKCLLDQKAGRADDVSDGSDIALLFGSQEKKGGPTIRNASRIIFRDSQMTSGSKARLEKLRDQLDGDYTEIKTENKIDRIKGTAEHPRTMERVPMGTVFVSEVIINVYENDNEKTLVQTFEQGLELLRADYLGKSGSRGYGHIQVELTAQAPLVL